MRSVISAAILVVLSITSSVNAAKPIVPHPAVTRNNEEQKLYIAAFSAEWCGMCKGVPEVVDNLRAAGYRVYKFDMDRHEEARRKLGVKSPPTIIIMNDGKVFKRIVGEPKKKLEELLKVLQKLRQKDAEPVPVTSPTLDYILG